MKTGSVNTQATVESLGKEGEVKRSKTEEASKESTPTAAAIRSKILEFLAKGFDSEKIVNALGQVEGLSSFSPANLLKIVQPVVDSMAKSTELSDSNKASAEKLLNFVKKKIENEEKENQGADLRVPTVGNQNPKSAAQASPRQEPAQANPRQEPAQASPTQEARASIDKQTHAQKVTAAAATTNSGRSL